MSHPPPDGSAHIPKTGNELRTFLFFLVTMLLLGAVVWLSVPRILPVVKGWLASRHVAELEKHTRAQNWQEAARAMQDARRWAPDAPAVLRACVRFLDALDGDPHAALSLARELQQNGAATPEDLALLGKTHIRLGDPAKARAVFTQIPTQGRQGYHALLLHAALLAADGRNSEADNLRRAAYASDLDTPANLLRLAALDLRTSDPARRRAVRERLWQAARNKNDLALPAIELLASTEDLTAPQAADLLQMVETQPASGKTDFYRFKVLSAQMRISPYLREDVLQAETLRWSSRKPGELAPFAAWLVAEGEHARLLRILPAKTTTAFTDLLPYHVSAFRAEGKWNELQQMLKSVESEPALPVQKLRLWQAEAHAHLDKDPSRTRQLLALIFEDAKRGGDLDITLDAATLAEHLNLWDIAENFYQALAVKHPRTRPSLLPKIQQMAEYQHDGEGMLNACSSLLELKPDSIPFLLRKLYLQMLLGTQIELAHQSLQNVAITGSVERVDQIHLLRALSAYRQGLFDELRDTLPRISKPENFPPGQRAVFAALLKLSGGDAGHVFRLIERVPAPILLPEEKTFLQRAL